jgi:hypothetical protein
MTIDTIDMQLWGPIAPAAKERQKPIIDAVANLDSDVICLGNVSDTAARQAVVAAELAHLKLAYAPNDDLDTAIDDPTDATGHVPPPPTKPPCASSDAAALDDLLACMRSNCGTANDADASMSDDSGFCIFSHCQQQVGTLDVAAPACWMCALGQLESRASFADARIACLSDPRSSMTWSGGARVILVTRRNLTGAAQWVLPATGSRVTILRASMSLPTGADLDVYCTELTAIGDGLVFPYVGQYGNGKTGAAAWREELLLQANKVVHYVAATSAAHGRRAIIAGLFDTGPDVPGVASAVAIESYTALTAAMPLAVPPGYQPECTGCADNPLIQAELNGTTTSTNSWTLYALLSGIPITDVKSAIVFLKERVVPYGDAGLVPLSVSYGFRTTVSIRP